jgi:hypothetical protein
MACLLITCPLPGGRQMTHTMSPIGSDLSADDLKPHRLRRAIFKWCNIRKSKCGRGGMSNPYLVLRLGYSEAVVVPIMVDVGSTGPTRSGDLRWARA